MNEADPHSLGGCGPSCSPNSLPEAGLRILARAKDLALEHRVGLTVPTELIEESTAHALSDASARRSRCPRPPADWAQGMR
ncbi:MAG: hypothetical protein ACRDOO_24105 [Actinomadura sp.]